MYYFVMNGKPELNQNGSVYCTWFVSCNCLQLRYCIKFGFLWTWNSLLLFPLWFDYIRSLELGRPFGGVCICSPCCCAILRPSTLASRNHTVICRRTSTSLSIPKEHPKEAFLRCELKKVKKSRFSPYFFPLFWNKTRIYLWLPRKNLILKMELRKS